MASETTAFHDYFRREVPPMAQSPDVAEWPEDVQATVRAVCEVFNLRPPSRGRRKAGPYSFWIITARELEDACLPHPVKDVLVEVQRDLSEAMHQGKGITVVGPGSLTNLARAKAGQIQSRQVFISRLDDDPISEEDGFVECPRCHEMVNPDSLNMRCRGAHYTRGHEAETA